MQRLVYTVPHAAEAVEMSVSKILAEIRGGRLATIKIGPKTLIRHEALTNWLESEERRFAVFFDQDRADAPNGRWGRTLNDLVDDAPVSVDAPSEDWMAGLSVRTRNVLKSEGIRSLEQLGAATESDLRKIPNLGKVTFNEIVAWYSKQRQRDLERS